MELFDIFVVSDFLVYATLNGFGLVQQILLSSV